MKHSSRFIICSDSRDGMPGIFFSCLFFFFFMDMGVIIFLCTQPMEYLTI